ncbi:MAG: hypothetical protein AAGD14_10700 [Planctomycetota bacterium]
MNGLSEETVHILAARCKESVLGERAVLWARRMLDADYASESLVLLAGEQPLFHEWVVVDFFDRAIAEHGIAPFTDEGEAARAVLTVQSQAFVDGRIAREEFLQSVGWDDLEPADRAAIEGTHDPTADMQDWEHQLRAICLAWADSHPVRDPLTP